MLYDNGGRGGPLPTLKPQPQLQPVYQQPWSQSGFKDGLVARANEARKSMGVTEPFEFQNFRQQPMGMAYAAPQQPMNYGQRPQYGFAGGGSMMGGGMGGAMGYHRRRRPLYARDMNGRTPGMWDYQQQPQYDRPPMQLY